MNELQVFENPEFGSIRTVEIDGEPWLVGKDVAAALGYKDTVNALKSRVDREDKRGWQITTPSGEQTMTIINESGLYSLILSSKLPGAKKFKRWVTAEVLPSIRKTGAYTAPPAEEAPATRKDIADLTAAVQLLIERMDARTAPRPALPEPLPFDNLENAMQIPGPAAKKRWMRTANEKLELLTTRKGRSSRSVLHYLYTVLERDNGVSLEEERMRVMEDLNLTDCSILTAIFYTDWLRDGFEVLVDDNLGPENRGW